MIHAEITPLAELPLKLDLQEGQVIKDRKPWFDNSPVGGYFSDQGNKTV